MSAHESYRSRLDAVAARVGTELGAHRARSASRSALRKSLWLLAAVPGLYLLAEFGQWTKDEPAWRVPVVLVAIVALLLPLGFAMFRAISIKRRGVPRASAIGEADKQVSLEGRLLAADEFTAREPRSSFEAAAIADAEERTAKAENARYEFHTEPVEMRRAATAWAGAGAVALALAGWVATWGRTPAATDDSIEVARAGETPAAVPEEQRGPNDPQERSVPEPVRPETANDRERTVEPQTADASPRVTQDAKESAGKTGSGRSSGAMSSSAASDSKSAPSSAGQKSDPSDNKAKPKEPDAKKPKESGVEPEEVQRPEDEQSGATAGKGSSKGSNKNPTASDWKSRDQVTDVDDQEVEDDEDTDEDEEEQENRGGVQPSLRDRRPPVSRDLQIGFGNRPNPDANGRGGPSEQKKSRGVASLVLGVPIPDRIKGRPGPGPTKITQERIEPEAEESTPVDATARLARDTPLDAPTAVTLDASIRTLVRNWFLAKRAMP